MRPRRTCDISIGSTIAIYRTSRPWWRRRWQGEWSDIYCARAETGYTRRHAELRTLRAWRAAKLAA